MPLYQEKNISDDQKIGIWEISESIEELKQLANSIALKEIPSFNSETRSKQWIATRLLLHHFFNDAEIIYDELGKPSLNNGWNISISHNNQFVVILLNKNDNCGVDIEKVDMKVERIKHKFLSDEDLQKITSEKDLTIYWGAKEALYKYYGKKEVLFIDNLFIENFDSNSNTFKGVINRPDFKTEMEMRWEEIGECILVHTL